MLADHGVVPAGESLRVVTLGEADRRELLALIDADPIVNAVADLRIRHGRIPGPGTVLGVRGGDRRLRAAAIDAGNLLPIGGGPAEWTVLGRHLRTESRPCSSIVGRRDAVAALWTQLARSWGTPRAVREVQPMLIVDRLRRPLARDLRVRPMRTADLDRYLPAAAAMFEEELGLAPLRGASASDYRRRVAGLIAHERAFGVVQDGVVVFKADLGTVTARTCQIQGVWVHPDLRGQGIATAAMAQVLGHALDMAPTASLYVNDFNEPARRLYARLGMTEIAQVSTILF